MKRRGTWVITRQLSWISKMKKPVWLKFVLRPVKKLFIISLGSYIIRGHIQELVFYTFYLFFRFISLYHYRHRGFLYLLKEFFLKLVTNSISSVLGFKMEARGRYKNKGRIKKKIKIIGGYNRFNHSGVQTDFSFFFFTVKKGLFVIYITFWLKSKKSFQF